MAASKIPGLRRRGGIARRRLGRALFALLAAAPAGAAVAQVPPPHLDILEALVREVPPLDPVNAGARTVAIELMLAGPPVCTGSSPFMAYGIQIDADRDPNTGITPQPFAPLGVDARISAECDQASSQFVSAAGPVVVGPPGAGGEVVLSITTTVALLPSVDFDWIAFAIEGSSFTRLPAEPDLARWAILERTTP